MDKIINIKASSVKANSVTLNWDKVSGAQSYEVYKYTESSKKYTKVMTVTTNTATIKDLKTKTNYTYAVKAVSKAGSKSAYSELLKVTTK